MPDIYGLAAVLVTGNSRNDLGHDRARHLKALRTLDHLFIHHGAVIQHITDIDQTAVKNRLYEIIRIVEVNGSLVMGKRNPLRKQHSSS